jgi:predicted transcriptional regulator
MKEESIRYLQKMYDSYRDNFEMKKKMQSKSVLISSLKVKNNDRFRPLNDSARMAAKMPSDVLFELKENEMIRNTDDVASFTISGKGIWFVEKMNGVIDEKSLIDFIDEKYFNLSESGKSLTDKEKVVIFGLLATRAFSQNSAADMRKDDYVKDAWKEIMKSSFEKLEEIGVIKNLKPDDLMPEGGIEHPASHLIRHTDSLPRKTRAIFNASGKNRYYLDLYDSDSLSVEKLAYMFWLVFGDSINSDNVENISDYCIDIAYNKSIYVFDLDEHKFSTPEYDELVRSGIMESIILRPQWSNE